MKEEAIERIKIQFLKGIPCNKINFEVNLNSMSYLNYFVKNDTFNFRTFSRIFHVTNRIHF